MANRIVVTQPIHEPVLNRLRQFGDVVMNPGPEPWTEAQRLSHLAQADAMMAFMPDKVDKALLDAAPRLRTIACALKGFDNFDLKACADAGVIVSFVPDLLTEPTAELALGLAIAAGRHIRHGDDLVRSGDFAGWRPTLYGMGLHGSRVAVVGLGAVGRAIIDRLSGFSCASLMGVDPQGKDPRVRKVSLEEALASADYLFLAVPLTSDSRHLLNAARLEHVKPGQIIINVGRGSVVHEEAVADALARGEMGAYAADVFEFEDWLLPDRPSEVSERLRSHPNTVFTPHLGSAVSRVRIAIEHRAADNLIAALLGQKPRDSLSVA